MDLDTILVTLLFMIPEGVLLAVVSLGLLGIKPPLGRLVAIGVLLGITTAIVRGMAVPFGIHTVLLGLVFVIFAKGLAGANPLASCAGYMMSVTIVMLGEQLLAIPLQSAFDMDLTSTLLTVWQHIQWGWISSIPLLVLAVLILCTDFVLIAAPAGKGRSEER